MSWFRRTPKANAGNASAVFSGAPLAASVLSGSASPASASSASAAPPMDESWRSKLKSLVDVKITVTESVAVMLDKEPLKTLMDQIAAKEAELDGLEAEEDALEGELDAKVAEMNAATSGNSGLVPAGATNFRGAKEPTLYVKNGNSYNVVGNYAISGYRFRNTNASYNSVLAKMRTRRASLGPILKNAEAANTKRKNVAGRLKTAMVDYRSLIERLRKTAAAELAKAAQQGRNLARQPIAAPAVRTSSAAQRLATARARAEPAPTPGLMSRLFGRRGGASRKRRASRKTRKAHRRR